METIAFILLGLISGLLAGLLGIGGGIVTVPGIYFILLFSGFPTEKIMQVAIATALASTFITSFGATWSNYKKETIRFSILKRIVPSLAVGAVAGALLAQITPDETLRLAFSVMAILFGVYFFFPRLPLPRIAPHPNWILVLLTLAVGCISSLLGVGGGLFLLPTLLAFSIPMKNTIAACSAGTLTTAFSSSLVFLCLGWGNLPMANTVGYIQIPATLFVGISSLLTTSFGVMIAHRIHTDWIQRVFAIVLASTGVMMALGR